MRGKKQTQAGERRFSPRGIPSTEPTNNGVGSRNARDETGDDALLDPLVDPLQITLARRRRRRAPSYWALRSRRSRRSPSLALASTPAERKKIGVNFVCLGNICRSPTAEAVFTECVRKANLDDRFDIDSCGTGGGNPNWYKPGGWSYHEGESSDPRMKEAASARGIAITSTSRPLRVDDFDRFEYIVGMDESNLGAIRLAASTWLPAMSDASPDYKVVLMSDYCRDHKVAKVPDPYYAGGFDKVIDLLVDACDGLLEEIRADHDL